ncbi:DUF6415 family natural product biosynthesis protein [Streptomyces sp. NPDC048650]|uniref:DUF6415 family natural product biosynthesis protein n=1 Tax=Streptomyces sp. NPDC048650 TaxID=3365583 RepID=UPI0037107563
MSLVRLQGEAGSWCGAAHSSLSPAGSVTAPAEGRGVRLVRRGLPPACRAVVTMTATTDAPGRHEIQESVDRALHLGPPPPYDDLVGLEQTLLRAIALLYAPVDEMVNGTPPDSADGCRLRARLDTVRRRTAGGLGQGLMSAQMQVRALARDCQWLLDQVRW